ncbi:arginine ABC transporter permease ArtQ [Parasalinivibrio latis]|uniref:arginine ABC transporter permease ArtQ n=1 Tax=Parasalinivibrio latis TaxID=2952610 RepID=UPI0030E17D87
MTAFLLLLMQAAGLTVGLALTALLVGLVFAMLLTAAEAAPWRVLRWPVTALVTVLRGLPEILVVLFAYFGSTQILFLLTGDFIEFSPFWCGVFALSSIFAAYASQTLRGALKAVPRGQWEAGLALGMEKPVIFFRLILPQLWRHALPGLGNQWLVLLKDTALVSLIGVNDLMRQAQLISTSTWQPFTWFAIAALIYLGITLVSQSGLKLIENHVTRFEKGAA